MDMTSNHKRLFAGMALFAVTLVITILTAIYTSPTLAQQQLSLTVSSAIALSEPLQEIKQIYQRQQPNVKLIYNLGASGALQQQIESGASVDVFISAAPKQMDALETKGLLLDNTRRNLVTNRIVLIVPKASKGISSLQDLTKSQVKRIAIGNPKSVPIGQYSEEIFKNVGITEKIKSRLVFGNTVRQVLGYVSSGNVDAGIVWVTDARTSKQVKVVQTIPENLHSPAIFPVAVIKNSQNTNAAITYVQFLFSNTAKNIFTKYGFRIAS
ncbi:molybdate ABC transporter substrate-binding protein [Fischerella thermalis]|uniref:molybdate ABC transporter substrate-binding protein n=1 Tax=Fischerella thermalis TaxID=372787 RepID=UPI0003027C58|nr:molybdate ABC transporter substrate-binding protein [Fischerella thermalis]PMB36916.1 molybdate ABC transporter substrate-binding protein [Fischerella thermalis CCMEE 5208]